MHRLLAIDAGKTSIRVGVFDCDLILLERWSTSSIDVQAALSALVEELRSIRARASIGAVGISMFGPLETDPARTGYGAIPESSDAAWSGVNLPSLVSVAVDHQVYFDYDVNAGAIAERMAGASRHVPSFVYLSVGTGVGGTIFRASHTPGYAPQLGHMYLPREADDMHFTGSCRFHGACLQGLASGRAILERWGIPGEQLPSGHPAWDLEARYLARACANLVYMFSPHKVVLGSSVSLVQSLIDQTNVYLVPLLNGFIEPELRSLYAMEPPVTRALLTPDSSLIGAAIMARDSVGLRFKLEPAQS